MIKRWVRLDSNGRVNEEIDFDPEGKFGTDAEWLVAKGKETIGWVRDSKGKFHPPEVTKASLIRRNDILAELQNIDARSARAMRESILYQDGELKNRLGLLEAKAVELRKELNAL